MIINTNMIMKLSLKMANLDFIPEDTEIYVEGNGIKKVLIGIDIDNAALLYAKNNGYDLVIGHHPTGSRLGLSKVFKRNIKMMVENGVQIQDAEKAVREKALAIEIGNHSTNYSAIPDFAKLIGMPYMNIHMPCDEIGRKIIQDKINAVCSENKEINLEELNNVLNDIPEIKNAKTNSEIRIGSPLSKAGRVIFSHGRGTNGGVEVANAYYKAGFDTVIYIHISYGDYIKLKKENKGNLIITGHISSDSVGINPFIQALEEMGVEVDTTGGIIKK